MHLPTLLLDVTSAWKMSFQSVHYLLFLPLAVGGYFVLPKAARRVWLLLASYYFYFFMAPKYLGVLLVGTALAYVFGRWVAGGRAEKNRRLRCGLSVAALALMLAFFKYNGFFAAFLAPAFEALGIPYNTGYFTTAGALGISFYTFTAIGYLIDVSRGDAPAERNPLDFALLLGFFPSVAMGPISRAGSLLPQLKDDSRRFDPQQAAAGLRRMAVGAFKKLAVANTLQVFTDAVYKDLYAYGGLTLTVAAIAFAVQLYFDFAGYTDIALGSARLLGIRLPENFKNPYFATNFSSFWQRWHISLSSFLQDYIFTPLVWSRWPERLPFVGRFLTKPPVLSSIAAVFLVSGIWHGDTLCYVAWGALMAAYRIGEELCHRTLGKPRKNPGPWARLGKRAVVLVLWVESLVFFRVGMAGAGEPGRVTDAVSALGRQFAGFSPAQLAADVAGAVQSTLFDKPFFVAAFIAFALVCTALALWADWYEHARLKGAPLADALPALRPAPRWLVYYGLVLGCFAGFLAQGGASFLYGGF